MQTSTNKKLVIDEITRAVSYKGLDLRHFNPALISKLVYANKLNSVEDIFELWKRDLSQFTNRKTTKMIIQNPPRKPLPLPNFIYTLGLCPDEEDYEHKLAVQFPDIHLLFKADCKTISGAVGPKLAKTIFSTLQDKRQLANYLYKVGRCPNIATCPLKREFYGIFKGKDFVVSGRFDNYRQTDIIETIVRAGGKLRHSVMGTTDFLFAGLNNSKTLQDRVKKARRLNVPVIDNDRLNRLFSIYGIK